MINLADLETPMARSDPRPEAGQVARVRRVYGEEIEAAYLYEVLAKREPDLGYRGLLQQLAAGERVHAAHWAAWLARADEALPQPRTSLRAHLLVGLARWFGTKSIAGLLARLEDRDARRYRSLLPEPALRRQERHHAQILTGLARGERNLAAIERRPRSGALNLRAAIFGANDGLVSILSLVAGVAGGTSDGHLVVLAGFAGLLAGACSMAGGEYISVRSQRELMEREIDLQRLELEESPAEELTALATVYRARGVPENDALRMAEAILGSPAALETLVLERLGLNPLDLGSGSYAAVSSFAAFALGGLVPVLTYALAAPFLALPATVAASAVALCLVGALVGVLAGQSLLTSSARYVAVGGLAATITYLAGRAFGTAALA